MDSIDPPSTNLNPVDSDQNVNMTPSGNPGPGRPANSGNSQSVGSGTTNQQRLKSHVQQFLNRIRKESDVFYKQFATFCKQNRELERYNEFHEGMGDMFKPYGDLLQEINKLLHPDYQYEISSKAQETTLKESEIGNDYMQQVAAAAAASAAAAQATRATNSSGAAATSASAGTTATTGRSGPGRKSQQQLQQQQQQQSNADQYEGGAEGTSSAAGGFGDFTQASQSQASTAASSQQSSLHQQQDTIEKFKKLSQIIKENYPEKMAKFIEELRNCKLTGDIEEQLRKFLQAVQIIFGVDHPIYQQGVALFFQNGQNGADKSAQLGAQLSSDNASAAASQGAGQASASSSLKQAKEGKGKRKLATQNSGAAQNNGITGNSSNSNTQVGDNSSTIKAGIASVTNQSTKGVPSVDSNGYQITVNGRGVNTGTQQAESQYGSNHSQIFRVPSLRKNDMESENNSTARIPSNNFPTEDQLSHSKILPIPGATKPEQTFMALIDAYMDPIAFTNMLKLFFLYVECIITAQEMLEQGTYLLSGFANPEKLIEQFKDLVECRESSRRKQNPNFKPLNDLDFNNNERFTHSYVEMPRFYPKFCSNSTELTRSVLNTSIVTVPQGTEHVTFSIMRKNQYEEQLFKSEDEKYEFDHFIQLFRQTKKFLEQIVNAEPTTSIANLRKTMQKVIDMKVLVNLYKHGSIESQEICDILLANPMKSAQLALDRVKGKLEEIERVKGGLGKKQWHEVSEKNFHRSLDHRSFIFKRYDRKFTVAARFEKEPEFRNKLIQKSSSYLTKQQQLELQETQKRQMTAKAQSAAANRAAAHGALGGFSAKQANDDNAIDNALDFETDVSQFFKFLNTFQGTTNVEKCSHAESENALIAFDYMKEQVKHVLPMMSFVFEDEDIVEDTFSLLLHYQQYAAINANEREKIKRTAIHLLKNVLGFSFKVLEVTDITVNENKTIRIVTDIENRIFEKIFAYLKPVQEKNAADGTAEEMKEEDPSNKENEEVLKIPKSSAANKQIKSPQRPKKNNDLKPDETPANAKEDNSHQSENSSNEMMDEEGDEDQSSKGNASNGQGESAPARPMHFEFGAISENIYLPKQSFERFGEHASQSQVFFGTKNLYVFLRFFYVLYERLYKAREISHSFEDNEKTRAMSAEEKGELANERYAMFKVILHGSLRMRENKYEDYLRSIFGKQAFLLFTIDKTLQAATKSLQTLASDDLSAKILAISQMTPSQFNQLEKEESSSSSNNNNAIMAAEGVAGAQEKQLQSDGGLLPEELAFMKINRMVLDSTQKSGFASDARCFFRFHRDRKSNIFHINYIESIYKNWDFEQIGRSKEYYEAFALTPIPDEQVITDGSESRVFLARNISASCSNNTSESTTRKKDLTAVTGINTNEIEYFAFPNSNRLITAGKNKQDVFISAAKLARKRVPLARLVLVEMKKTVAFNAWLEKTQLEVLNIQKEDDVNNDVDENDDDDDDDDRHALEPPVRKVLKKNKDSQNVDESTSANAIQEPVIGDLEEAEEEEGKIDLDDDDDAASAAAIEAEEDNDAVAAETSDAAVVVAETGDLPDVDIIVNEEQEIIEDKAEVDGVAEEGQQQQEEDHTKQTGESIPTEAAAAAATEEGEGEKEEEKEDTGNEAIQEEQE